MGNVVLDYSQVYRLCVKKQYFTAGCNSAYNKMFSMINGDYTLREVAVVIWVCSVDVELEEIIKELEAIAVRSEANEED